MRNQNHIIFFNLAFNIFCLEHNNESNATTIESVNETPQQSMTRSFGYFFSQI